MGGQAEPVRVLVAEDSDTERAICVNGLRDAGLEVHEATDGRYALDLTRIIHPDVLVLDLGLPRVSGLEVLRKLRADRKVSHTPVIVLTADGRDQTVDLAFYEGATDFVTKPVDPLDLVARVREVLGKPVQAA